MRKSWAISGVDLHLDVPSGRVRAGLEAALREAICSGRLAPGTRLPPSRGLAHDLALARNTLAEAYCQLAAEGWLVARQGSGTTVAERPPAPVPRPPSSVPVRRPPRYDLTPGSPDLSAFPRSAWVAALRRALAGAPSAALGYSDPGGRPELRAALSQYLARARGVRAAPERIVVCSGFTQGLGLLCEVLRDRGERRLAVEAYGLPAHRRVIASRGLATELLAVDGHGARIEELGDLRAVLLTPAHQFPLGAALSAQRRTALVRRSVARRGLVIEDDYDGEFRYDRTPIGAVQALAPEQIAYVGTASKSLAPGLRLAWLVLPTDLIEPVTAAKAGADVHSSVLDQLALARLVSDGGYDRHIRRCRLSYRRRRDHLVATLRAHVPQARVTGIAAGLHALIHLPPGRAEAEVVAQAAERGLALLALADFRAGGPEHPPALVVGYATPPQHAFTAAVARLAAVLR